jgi:8-oxo-dGTP pyrophosphatase MutT (NUDIX family)
VTLADRLAAALAARAPAQAERDPPFREAAVGVLLAPHGDDLACLFLHRATHHGDPWSGQIGLPGGRREPDDADLVATMRREVHEETGVDLDGLPLLGQLDENRPRTPLLPAMIVRPYVVLLPTTPALTLSAEAASAFWAPLGALFDPAATREVTVEARGLRMRVPAIVHEERVIWGMTERILRTLEALV